MRRHRQSVGVRRHSFLFKLGDQIGGQLFFAPQAGQPSELLGPGTRGNFTTALPSRFTLPMSRTRGLMRDRAGWVAQLVEQRTENPCVGGSIPPPATISDAWASMSCEEPSCNCQQNCQQKADLVKLGNDSPKPAETPAEPADGHLAAPDCVGLTQRGRIAELRCFMEKTYEATIPSLSAPRHLLHTR